MTCESEKRDRTVIGWKKDGACRRGTTFFPQTCSRLSVSCIRFSLKAFVWRKDSTADFLKSLRTTVLCAKHFTRLCLNSQGHSKVTTYKINHIKIVLIVTMVFLSSSWNLPPRKSHPELPKTDLLTLEHESSSNIQIIWHSLLDFLFSKLNILKWNGFKYPFSYAVSCYTWYPFLLCDNYHRDCT